MLSKAGSLASTRWKQPNLQWLGDECLPGVLLKRVLGGVFSMSLTVLIAVPWDSPSYVVQSHFFSKLEFKKHQKSRGIFMMIDSQRSNWARNWGAPLKTVTANKGWLLSLIHVQLHHLRVSPSNPAFLEVSLVLRPQLLWLVVYSRFLSVFHFKSSGVDMTSPKSLTMPPSQLPTPPRKENERRIFQSFNFRPLLAMRWSSYCVFPLYFHVH